MSQSVGQQNSSTAACSCSAAGYTSAPVAGKTAASKPKVMKGSLTYAMIMALATLSCIAQIKTDGLTLKMSGFSVYSRKSLQKTIVI